MRRVWRWIADVLWWAAEKAEDRAAPFQALYPWTKVGYRLDPKTGKLRWFEEKVYPQQVFK